MKLSITYLLLFSLQFGIAQDNWINYTNTHRIKDVIETDNGFWLGSEGGLCYYNIETGDEKYYNRGNSLIPSNGINDLLYHTNGDLWISTVGGLAKMSGNEIIPGPEKLSGSLLELLDNRVVVVNLDSLYVQVEDMEFEAIANPAYFAALGGAAVDQNTGALYVFVNNWFADSYLAVWQNNEWTILDSDNSYDSSMAMDKNNKLWLINTSGLQYFDGSGWIVVDEAQFPEELRYPILHVNHENQILIENQNECVRLFVWDGVSIEELEYNEGDCPEDVYFIKSSDREDDIYFSSSLTNGFYSFSSNEINEPKRLAQSPVLSNFVANTLHLSDDSHIVIYFDAIQHIKSGVWSEIPVPDNLSRNIKKGFLDVNENLWIYDNISLWSYIDEEWNILPLPSEIDDDLGLAAFGDNGDIWIQSNLNLARYRNGEWKVFKTIHHGSTTTIMKDMKVDPKNGDLWVTTFLGVIQYDGLTWISYQPDYFNHTYGLTLGNGGIYVRFSNELKFIKNGEVTSIPMPMDGYYSTFTSRIKYDASQDALLMTGSSRLAVYKDDEWKIYNTSDSGIYTGSTNDISIDSDENVWLSGSGGGVCIYNKNGITTLSVEEEGDKGGAFLDGFKVYPTLIWQDGFYIKAENRGKYQITISTANGQLVYNQEHILYKDLPERVEIPIGESGLFFVSIRDGYRAKTQKVLWMNEK